MSEECFKQVRDLPETDSRATFEELVRLMAKTAEEGDPVFLPSKFWQALNVINLSSLAGGGYQTFKQTVATNYFTWIVESDDDQLAFLRAHTAWRDWAKIIQVLWTPMRGTRLHFVHRFLYKALTAMLWCYVSRRDPDGLLEKIHEPLEGTPFPVYGQGRLLSQDLANSVLEYYAVRDCWGPSDDPMTVCELGAGYGRTAYLFLQARPRTRYVIVDIPPALAVAQRYLSAVLPQLRVFRFHPFSQFKDVRDELEASALAFLLPHQAAMLPAKSVDLFISISSLQEMRPDQITSYFLLIDRLTRGFFYMKQWKASQNPHDHLTIRQEDYPIPPNWRPLFVRQAPVQVRFFEAMYRIGDRS